MFTITTQNIRKIEKLSRTSLVRGDLREDAGHLMKTKNKVAQITPSSHKVASARKKLELGEYQTLCLQ